MGILKQAVIVATIYIVSHSKERLAQVEEAEITIVYVLYCGPWYST